MKMERMLCNKMQSYVIKDKERNIDVKTTNIDWRYIILYLLNAKYVTEICLDKIYTQRSKTYVAYTPGYCTFVASSRGLISLAFYT